MENGKIRLQIFMLFMISMIVSNNSYAQKKEKGWTSLFDGKTLKGWKKLAGDANYKVQNGTIIGTTVANTGNSFLATDKEYGDFVLELDFKIDDTTNNSGIQTRSHYDPAGHNGKGRVYGRQYEIDPKTRRWTAGVYDEGRRGWLYPLTLNPKAQDAFKLGEYNHIKIENIGDEIKTWINGIPAAYLVDTMDRKGFIALQVHAVDDPKDTGSKVYFKNIKIKTNDLKPSAMNADVYVVNNKSNSLTDYEKQQGWKLLFDGKTSNGWRSAKGNGFPASGWKIENGVISVISSEGKESANGGDIVTEDQYNAFDLSFDFKLTTGANSGLKYFVTLAEDTKGSAIGLEYQILDDKNHPDAKLGIDGNRTLSSLYDLIKAGKQEQFIRPIGEWNTGRVVVYPDNKVEHYLNGAKVLEYQRGSREYRDLVANSKYKIWPGFGEAKRGHILLQDHGDEVSFKNIKIKTL
jgi:hypothetical protein